MRNFFVRLPFLLALTLFTLMLNARSVAPSPNASTCNLPAPSNFQCVSTTPTSASLTWNLVPGASSYTLKTYLNTTFVLVNTTVVPGDITAADIPNLDPGTAYVTHIYSKCDNGQLGEGYTSASYQTIILELVVNGFIEGGIPNGCELENPSGNYCTFPLTGSTATYQVYNGNGDANFTVEKNPAPGSSGILVKAENSNPTIQFLGIPVIISNSCQINQSCNNLTRVRIYENINEQLSIIAEILVKKSPESGLLQTTGFIKDGYQIKQVKLGGRPEAPTSSPTARDRENPEDSAVKMDIRAVNPFSEQIQINLDSDSNDPVFLQLFDLQGRLLHQNEYSAGAEQYTMETTDVLPGLYLLRVKIGSQITHLKLIKAQ